MYLLLGEPRETRQSNGATIANIELPHKRLATKPTG